MHCDNVFCIYWSEKACMLNKVSLDIQGNCQDCIYVNIEKDVLQRQREKVLKSFDEEYRKLEEK